jgi:hypothetical protein
VVRLAADDHLIVRHAQCIELSNKTNRKTCCNLCWHLCNHTPTVKQIAKFSLFEKKVQVLSMIFVDDEDRTSLIDAILQADFVQNSWVTTPSRERLMSISFRDLLREIMGELQAHPINLRNLGLQKIVSRIQTLRPDTKDALTYDPEVYKKLKRYRDCLLTGKCRPKDEIVIHAVQSGALRNKGMVELII